MDLAQFFRDVGVRVDEDTAPAVLRRMSVDTDALTADLRARGLRWDSAENASRPDAADLDKTARYLIDSAARSSGILGAASGLVGFAGVPPEAVARLVHSFRLAQRLAFIYGHDPETDLGKIRVRQALSEAWGFELPAQASDDIKLSQLPKILESGTLAIHDGPAWLIQTLARSAAGAVGRRATRWIPGLGAGMGLLYGRRLARQQGVAMHDAIKRRWNGPMPKHIEDAVEITA